MDEDQSSQIDSSSITNENEEKASLRNLPMEEEQSESRTKTPISMDEETSSSTCTKTTDDDGSTAVTSSSYSTSENTIDKDPESQNECQKALEILKEFAKLGETTPRKKRDYSFEDVDDAFEGSSSVGRVASSLDALVEDKLKISESESAASVLEDSIAVSSILDEQEKPIEKESTHEKDQPEESGSKIDFNEFTWNPDEESESQAVQDQAISSEGADQLEKVVPAQIEAPKPIQDQVVTPSVDNSKSLEENVEITTEVTEEKPEESIEPQQNKDITPDNNITTNKEVSPAQDIEMEDISKRIEDPAVSVPEPAFKESKIEESVSSVPEQVSTSELPKIQEIKSEKDMEMKEDLPKVPVKVEVDAKIKEELVVPKEEPKEDSSILAATEEHSEVKLVSPKKETKNEVATLPSVESTTKDQEKIKTLSPKKETKVQGSVMLDSSKKTVEAAKNIYYKCIVCRSDKKPLYSFPVRSKLSKKWEDNLKIVALPKHKICKIHFEDDCFGDSKLKLKFDAIPTKNLGKGEVVHINEFREYYHRKCNALNCKSTDSEIKLFSFPKKERMREKWIDLLKVNIIKDNMYACRLHFDKEFWNRRRLPYSTLPNEMIDQEEEEEMQIYRNIETDQKVFYIVNIPNSPTPGIVTTRESTPTPPPIIKEEEDISPKKEEESKELAEPENMSVDLLPEEMELLKQAEVNEANETANNQKSSSSSSESDEEFFTGKECINTNCTGKSIKLVKASSAALKYYYAKEKKQTQFVCKRCRSNVIESFISMTDMLLNGEALLLAPRPKKSDLVQLIDSSDDEKEEGKVETTEGESSLDEETLELIDTSLIPTIKSVFKQIKMGDQIRKNEQILQNKVDTTNKKIDFLLSSLGDLQNEADAIGKRIYSCTRVNYKDLPPVDCGSLVLTDASNFVPAMGPIEFAEVMVNSAYYGQIRDPLQPWVKGKVIYKEKNGVYSFSYAATGRFTQRSMAKRHLAYLECPEKRVDTGARIIALYDTFRLQGKLQGNPCWMVGIVAEPAKSQNKYRYLVFFDNGYAQYVNHSDIRLICGPSPQVWEDVHVSNRDFIKDYLQQYQFHRPMVRTQVGQKMLTRWDGRFFNSTVVDIDCSLIQMQSDRDSQKLEWLYRGSKRLEPVYKAYRKEQSEKLQRDFQAKQLHAQQLRRQELNAGNTSTAVTAKKKTYATRQPPQPVRHLNNAIIYVDDEPNNKGKIEYLTVKQEHQPKPYRNHECSSKCLLEMNYKQLKSYSPLAKPLICGWSRQIFKGKGRKFVVYKTPCGFSCRNMQAVHTYLRQTKNPLNVESFDFSWEVNCLAQYEDKSYELRIEDLSNGLEQMAVECVNYYDKTHPPPCEYSTKRIPTEGVNLNLDEEFLIGCDCEGDCSIRKDCACWQLTLRAAKFFNLNAAEVGYHNKRLYDGVSTGIYECNSRCKCSSQCVNRVVQHPLELKLQVFKTNNRGWGIRGLNDIPKGCFICVYAGNLLTEQNANEGGKDTGDEYFAELDYIEVVEKQKEGYESDAESMSQSDSEDEYNPASNDLEWKSSKKVQRQVRRSASGPVNREQRERKKNKFLEEEESPKKYKSIRKYYGTNEACYVMDAKVTGNLGRYFNHSCDPNLYVQNVFVDTHDLRFPWVAFFSSKFIRAGTELTWNYNYEVGVVPGKVLYCECGAFNCRGRLL
ncbi:egg family protein [Megaselia abdita]